MESVPDEMVVFTGLVLSVKVPKVPMPATAAAAPRTPSEPTTLRAVGLSVRFLILVLMSVSPCVPVAVRHRGFRRQGELWGANRRAPARVPQGIRKACARDPRIG